MKRPQPNINEFLRNEYIGNLKTCNGIRKRWGTEVINGTEVFKRRQFYYPEAKREDNFESLFKFIGAYYGVTEGQYEGVEDAWLYLNKNNGTEIPGLHVDFVSENLNKLWWNPDDGEMPEDLTITSSVIIDSYAFANKDPERFREIINIDMEKDVAIQSIVDNYEELWDMVTITHEGIGKVHKGTIHDSEHSVDIPDEDDLTPDDPWLSALMRNALRDFANVTVNVKSLAIGTATHTYFDSANEGRANNISTTFVLDIEIPYREFTATSNIVEYIANDLTRTYSAKAKEKDNGYITKKAITSMDSTDLEENNEIITRSYTLWEDIAEEADSRFNSLWLLHNGVYYLKAGPFTSPRTYGFTFKELSPYLSKLIDGDYRKKKVPWYKKAIAYALVIAAIVITVVTLGKGLKGAELLVFIAKTILYVSLATSLTAAVLSAAGSEEWASALTEVNKTLEPLVIAAQIIIAITGFIDMYDTAKTALEAPIKNAAGDVIAEGVEATVSEVLAEMVLSSADGFIDNIIQGAKDVFSGTFNTEASAVFASNLANTTAKLQNMKLESINDRLKDVQAEYEDIMKEATQESDLFRAFLNIQPKPATADWSIYAAVFDHPYERGGGNLAIGNIQRTTKQAMRKARYDDPVFADIFIV
jgi:hypothetical protein